MSDKFCLIIIFNFFFHTQLFSVERLVALLYIFNSKINIFCICIEVKLANYTTQSILLANNTLFFVEARLLSSCRVIINCGRAIKCIRREKEHILKNFSGSKQKKI